jgi:ABC-2 type transport system permease protein
MQKFLAIVKREYVQRVRSRMFIVATILGPLVMSLFGVVPALIFSIKTGGPVHIAVVDQTGRLYERLALRANQESGPQKETGAPALNANTVNANATDRMEQTASLQDESFALEEVIVGGRSLNNVKFELNRRIRESTLDGYLVLPVNLLQDGKPEYFGRNTGDVFTTKRLERLLSEAVREQRLADANIDANVVRLLSRPVSLQSIKIGSSGEEKDRGEGFILVFATGFVIYLTILMYGQIILGAVIEEKETRIAEILFSSVKPFTLMIGKLVGVSLVALTQLAVWASAFIAFTLFGVSMLASRGLPIHIPSVPPLVFLYFALFFLLGYFIYATIYALVGSMVTTAQEGGQLAMPIILFLVIGFYLAFPVIKSPDSSFAFWVSMFPFFSPITMLVRIVTQTPPFTQILLSLVLGFGTALLLLWLASRIYRVGMLMYGKKATIPEVARWVRQP